MTPTPDSIAFVHELQEMLITYKCCCKARYMCPSHWVLTKNFPSLAESFLHLSEENTRLEEKLVKLMEFAEDSVFKSNGAIGYPPMDEYDVAAHEANEKLIHYISLLHS